MEYKIAIQSYKKIFPEVRSVSCLKKSTSLIIDKHMSQHMRFWYLSNFLANKGSGETADLSRHVRALAAHNHKVWMEMKT